MKTLYRLENLIFVIILFLPSYLWRFKIAGLPTNFLECLFFVFFVLVVLNGSARKKVGIFFGEYKNYIPVCFLLFVGLVLASLKNTNLFANLGIIKGWFLFPLVFTVLALSVLEKERRKIFWWLYLSAFLVSIISIGYLLGGYVTFDGRLEAFFNSPNYLAMYLSPAVIIGGIVLQRMFNENKKEERYKKIFFIVSLVLILVSLYKTFSYASWVAVAVSLVVVAFWNKKLSVKKLVVVLGMLLILIVAQLNTDKFKSIMTLNERSSLASRIMIWKSAIKIIENNWLLGIGPANFQEKYLDYQKYFPPYLEWAVPHPHNLLLSYFLFSGILGAAGFLGILLIWFDRFLRNTDDLKRLAIPLGIMVYILILGLFDTYIKNDLSVVFWIVIFSI